MEARQESPVVSVSSLDVALCLGDPDEALLDPGMRYDASDAMAASVQAC